MQNQSLAYVYPWSSWKTSYAQILTTESLQDLFHNNIPSIIFKNFATLAECKLLHRALNDIGFEYYLNVEPKIGRIGVTQ